jgi:hypothetical protein
MACNFVTDTINYILCKQFTDLRQYNCDSNFKVLLCPFLLPAFASLLLLQQLKEIMQSRQTIKCEIYHSVQNGIIQSKGIYKLPSVTWNQAGKQEREIKIVYLNVSYYSSRSRIVARSAKDRLCSPKFW